MPVRTNQEHPRTLFNIVSQLRRWPWNILASTHVQVTIQPASETMQVCATWPTLALIDTYSKTNTKYFLGSFRTPEQCPVSIPWSKVDQGIWILLTLFSRPKKSRKHWCGVFLDPKFDAIHKTISDCRGPWESWFTSQLSLYSVPIYPPGSKSTPKLLNRVKVIPAFYYGLSTLYISLRSN